MYRCNDCGAKFETPIVECEGTEDETVELCPSCGSDYILCDVGDVDELEDDE